MRNLTVVGGRGVACRLGRRSGPTEKSTTRPEETKNGRERVGTDLVTGGDGHNSAFGGVRTKGEQ